MKIKFLKDYRYPGGGYSNKGDVQTFEDTEFVKWAIDNGFAEEVKESGWWKPRKEPTWVRKQIERVDITAGYKYTDIEYRFIKPFYYDDAECGVDVYAKNSTSYQRFYMDDKPDELGYLNQVAFINQLVRDGYIEIQDNPNIVWEEL